MGEVKQKAPTLSCRTILESSDWDCACVGLKLWRDFLLWPQPDAIGAIAERACSQDLIADGIVPEYIAQIDQFRVRAGKRIRQRNCH